MYGRGGMAGHNSKCVSKKERRELIQLLQEKGYEFVRSNGGHSIYKNIYNGNVQTITLNLNKMIYKRIVKEVTNTITVA